MRARGRLRCKHLAFLQGAWTSRGKIGFEGDSTSCADVAALGTSAPRHLTPFRISGCVTRRRTCRYPARRSICRSWPVTDTRGLLGTNILRFRCFGLISQIDIARYVPGEDLATLVDEHLCEDRKDPTRGRPEASREPTSAQLERCRLYLVLFLSACAALVEKPHLLLNHTPQSAIGPTALSWITAMFSGYFRQPHPHT